MFLCVYYIWCIVMSSSRVFQAIGLSFIIVGFLFLSLSFIGVYYLVWYGLYGCLFFGIIGCLFFSFGVSKKIGEYNQAKFCYMCGQKNVKNAVFCSKCGNKFEKS